MLSPPPSRDKDLTSQPWQKWFTSLQSAVNSALSSAQGTVTQTVSTITNLVDLATRNHNDLQNIDGGVDGDRQHLTTTQVNDLMLKSVYDTDLDGVVDGAESIPVFCRNNTGVTIPALSVVYITGAIGQRPTVALAQANSEATSAGTIGLIKADILNNADGWFHSSAGRLHEVNTSAFADGASLWLSATVAGGLTATRPLPPNHAVFIGHVAYSHAVHGIIVLNIQNGYELSELHDVQLTTPANLDVLQYDSASLTFKNAATNGTGNVVRSISPVIQESQAATATAAGTNQATGTPINTRTTIFTTVASGTGGTLVSVVGAGVRRTVDNDGANALLLYPPSGGAISGYAVDAPVTIPVGGVVELESTSTINFDLITGLNVSFNSVDVRQNVVVPASVANTAIRAVGADGASVRIGYDSFGSLGSHIYGRSAGGTAATPTASLIYTSLLLIAGYGYGTTGYSSAARGYIIIAAAENWTDTAQGTYFSFYQTPNGSTTAAQRMSLTTSGLSVIGALSATTSILSSGATSGIGYSTGAGGTVTQATSKATGVTLNKVCGDITMNSAALAAGAIVSFTLTNSAIAATDQIVVTHQSVGTLGEYNVLGSCAAGSAVIYVKNTSAASLAEAIVLRYKVIKGVTA